jgi:hypothetical protein
MNFPIATQNRVFRLEASERCVQILTFSWFDFDLVSGFPLYSVTRTTNTNQATSK